MLSELCIYEYRSIVVDLFHTIVVITFPKSVADADVVGDV